MKIVHLTWWQVIYWTSSNIFLCGPIFDKKLHKIILYLFSEIRFQLAQDCFLNFVGILEEKIYVKYKRWKLKGIQWMYSTKIRIAQELAKVQIIALQCNVIRQSIYFQLLSKVESTYSQPKKDTPICLYMIWSRVTLSHHYIRGYSITTWT